MTERIRQTPGCIASTVAESTIVLSPTMQYVELDRVGAEIWHALATQDTPDGVCDELSRTYTVDPDRLRDDVERYLAQLRDLGLVELVSA